ncbi:MAG: hypothetical protein JOZ24_04230 [Candidatus Eremiobacteraeota bacterium]|nr:hypothetical protein [Candidatus Eremiobacteraeota bacterium]
MTSDREQVSDPFLVVTGSSAGGIDALIAFLTRLPATFAAPVVIAQHQAPGHTSRLTEILRSKTPLAVEPLDGKTALQPGTVYVVGEARDVEILDGSATVMPRAEPGPKPSIDRLFQTAAEAYGDRLIAIIFSGMGSDGLAGARVVKAQGGTVVVQQPESAAFPHMPLAIPPNLIDISTRPEAMGQLLDALVRVPAQPHATAEQNVLRTLLIQLRDRSGVDFTQYKTPTITRRLSRLMVAAGITSISEYLQHLQAHPQAYRRLVSTFLIKVTDFFRDAPLFDELRTTIVPRLVADARERGSELRIWSAGTSTGEEAYSLAILCSEVLREQDADVSVRIFATDLDEEAIAFARRGVYSTEALRHLPPGWVERYFIRAGEAYEVSKRIRNMTVFGQHDLGQRSPFPRIDLCLCRNVLIYFTKELQTRALQLFAFALRDGGYLILGKAESPTALEDYFHVVDASLKIYQRQGNRTLIPPARLRETLADEDHHRMSGAPARTTPQREGVPVGAEPLEIFAAGSSFGVIVVDRRYDIVSLNGAARNMLKIHGVAVGEDLLHLLHDVDAKQVRSTIDAAFSDESVTPLELHVRDPAGDGERWLLLSPMRIRSLARAGEVVVLLILDVTASAGRRRELERVTSEQARRLDDLGARIDELGRRHRGLLQANDELADANAELRRLNEQLLINSEEAASANEEIETLNEEMQATNEELETLNEELQATVEELNTSNDELQARGGDLERIAAQREVELTRVAAQREALSTILDSVAGSVVVVGRDDEILYAGPSLPTGAVDALRANALRDGTVALDGARYHVVRRADAALPYIVLELRRVD